MMLPARPLQSRLKKRAMCVGHSVPATYCNLDAWSYTHLYRINLRVPSRRNSHISAWDLTFCRQCVCRLESSGMWCLCSIRSCFFHPLPLYKASHLVGLYRVYTKEWCGFKI
jgi:hypothetical protein